MTNLTYSQIAQIEMESELNGYYDYNSEIAAYEAFNEDMEAEAAAMCEVDNLVTSGDYWGAYMVCLEENLLIAA